MRDAEKSGADKAQCNDNETKSARAAVLAESDPTAPSQNMMMIDEI